MLGIGISAVNQPSIRAIKVLFGIAFRRDGERTDFELIAKPRHPRMCLACIVDLQIVQGPKTFSLAVVGQLLHEPENNQC